MNTSKTRRKRLRLAARQAAQALNLCRDSMTRVQRRCLDQSLTGKTRLTKGVYRSVTHEPSGLLMTFCVDTKTVWFKASYKQPHSLTPDMKRKANTAKTVLGL